MTPFIYAKCFAEKCLNFNTFPLSLYINNHLALPSLCRAPHNDGWGEGFEQREINIGEGKLYVHLWNWDNWDIWTEKECFGPKFAEGLPEMCWALIPSTGELICIKRGESGYHHSDWDTGDPVKNREIADYSNQKRGISKAQEEAMLYGSICGWSGPDADPKSYEQAPPQQEIGGMTLA